MKIINQKKKYTNCVMNLMYMKSCRRASIKVSIYLIFLIIALLIALIPNLLKSISNTKKLNMNVRVRYPTDLKYILIWKHSHKPKKSYGIKDINYLTGQKEFIKQRCPHINCYITYNKTLLKDEDNFDVVVFDINEIKKVTNLNLERSPKQIYVFKSFESADQHPICDQMFDNFFNLTWTYKVDSDLPHFFFSIYENTGRRIGPKKDIDWKRDMAHTEIYMNKIYNKTKAVSWFITNCKLKNKYRVLIEELKYELQGYNYTLDLIGPCSERKCQKGRISQCYSIIEKEYFFNLITEDAISEDYVTEKMMRAMTYLTVPLVYGGGNYSNFLPPGSYINARDFGLKKLGAVIDYLIKNPFKYSYFFDWKQYYYYTTNPRHNVCDLCAKINQNGNKRKTYKNIRRWWNADFDNVCQRTVLYDKFSKHPKHSRKGKTTI